MPKHINCYICSIYLGEIRDARIRKDMQFLCPTCTQKVEGLVAKAKKQRKTDDLLPPEFRSIFGM